MAQLARVLFILLVLTASRALAETPIGPESLAVGGEDDVSSTPVPLSSAVSSPSTSQRALRFLAGGAVAFAAHESGHLFFDVAFDAHPGVRRVTGAGIPFFAITHDPGVSRRQEFLISSAGFCVQHAGSEWLLTRRPNLRRENAPFAKGVLAFNVLTSAVYSGAAFARSGPAERDTRGIAASARVAEPWVGAVLLVPAGLDAYRYYHPEARWAVWASRAAKAGLILLVLR